MKVSTNQLRVEIVSGLKSVERSNSEEAERGGGRISEKRGEKRGQ